MSSEHNHHHTHEHSHGELSAEESIALLKYMCDHNRHHAEELHEISHTGDEKAAALLHEAVDDLISSADKIEAALKILEG